MTTTTTAPTVLSTGSGRLLGTAALAGTALGVLDLVMQLTLPYPVADLANSSAVWALAAYALAVVTRATPARAAVAGTVLLVVAVEAYYVLAILLDRAGTASLWSTTTVLWIASGVLAGTVFGVAGAWARSERAWPAAAGLAAASAVLLAEAGVRLLPGSPSGITGLATAALTAGLGVAVLLTAASRPAHLARAVLLVPPLVVAGLVAFRLAGR